MKPLYKLSDKNKETKINLFIYDVLGVIDKKVAKWFDDVFINKLDYIPEELLTNNLKRDIDYLLTQAIWLINLGKDLGYSIDAESSVQSIYDLYTTNPLGYRTLVSDKRYNKQTHTLYTPEQVIENQIKYNEIS